MEINESNYAACIARIAARGSIGKKEAVDLLEAVSEAGEKQRRSGVEDPIATAAWQLARDLAEKAEERKADALRNAGIRQARMNEATTGGLKGAMSRLHSTLYWMPGPYPRVISPGSALVPPSAARRDAAAAQSDIGTRGTRQSRVAPPNGEAPHDENALAPLTPRAAHVPWSRDRCCGIMRASHRGRPEAGQGTREFGMEAAP